MAVTIAISGKGGSGKTTLSAMMIRALIESTGKAVLAVDADPNSCLGLTVGVEPAITIAEIREATRSKGQTDAGVDKIRQMEFEIESAVTEAKGFDLLTMGRPEGPSCYCAVNNLLRKFLDKLSSSYSYVVVDNEAGMEHLSRRTTNDVDFLCIAAESSPIGIVTAKRIFELAKNLPITVKQIGMIWNGSKNGNVAGSNEGTLQTFGCVPFDKQVLDASMEGKSIFDIKEDNPAYVAVKQILEQKLKT